MSLDRTWAALAIAALTLISTAAQGQQPVNAKLRLGVMLNYDTLPVWVGRDEGYFKAEGIDLDLVVTTGGAISIPAMEGGSLDIAYADVVTILRASERGLKMKIVAPSGIISPTPDKDGTRFLALDASPIRTLQDVRGKRVGVNLLGNLAHLYTMASLDKAGVAPGQYKVLEFPYPQMPDMLLSGQVDMAFFVDPFGTIAAASGKVRDLGSTVHSVHPNFRVSAYVVAQRWIEGNQQLARRFQRAYHRAADFVTQHKERQGDWQVKYFRLKPELKDKVATEEFRDEGMGAEFVASLTRTRDYMLKYKFLQTKIDPETLIFR